MRVAGFCGVPHAGRAEVSANDPRSKPLLERIVRGEHSSAHVKQLPTRIAQMSLLDPSRDRQLNAVLSTLASDTHRTSRRHDNLPVPIKL